MTNLLGGLITMYIEFPTLHGLIKIKIRALTSKESLGWENNRLQWSWIFNAYKYLDYSYQATPYPPQSTAMASWGIPYDELTSERKKPQAWIRSFCMVRSTTAPLWDGLESWWWNHLIYFASKEKRQKLWVNTYLCTVPKVKVKSFSHVRLFATPWNVAHRAPPSMGFCRQEYWSGLPFPSPGDLPNPGIEPRSPYCRQTL